MKSLMAKAVVAKKEALLEWILFCSTTFFHKPFHKRKGMMISVVPSNRIQIETNPIQQE
jgi:hypothetical protein